MKIMRHIQYICIWGFFHWEEWIENFMNFLLCLEYIYGIYLFIFIQNTYKRCYVSWVDMRKLLWTVYFCRHMPISLLLSSHKLNSIKERVWVLVFIFNKVWKFFSVMLNLVHYSKRHCNSCFVFLFIPIKIYYTFEP